MLLAGAAVGATAAVGLSPSKGGEKGNNKNLENYIKESVNRVLVGALLGTMGIHSRGKSTTVLSWVGDKIKDIFDAGTSKINKPNSKLADDSNLLDAPIIPEKEAIEYINGGMLGAYCEQEASKMPQVIAFKDGEYTEIYALRELQVELPFMGKVEHLDMGKIDNNKLYTYQKIYSNEPQLNLGIILAPGLVAGLKDSKWVNKSIRNTTESPALKDSPYSPEAVNSRVKPPYETNPAHDKGSPLYNPKKGPEPPDAANVYQNSVRADMGTWYGISADGKIYRFFYDNVNKVHFSGYVTKEQVPKAVRIQLGIKY